MKVLQTGRCTLSHSSFLGAQHNEDIRDQKTQKFLFGSFWARQGTCRSNLFSCLSFLHEHCVPIFVYFAVTGKGLDLFSNLFLSCFRDFALKIPSFSINFLFHSEVSTSWSRTCYNSRSGLGTKLSDKMAGNLACGLCAFSCWFIYSIKNLSRLTWLTEDRNGNGQGDLVRWVV